VRPPRRAGRWLLFQGFQTPLPDVVDGDAYAGHVRVATFTQATTPSRHTGSKRASPAREQDQSIKITLVPRRSGRRAATAPRHADPLTHSTPLGHLAVLTRGLTDLSS